jgi:hypothetical protein
LPGAIAVAELSEALDLVTIKDRPWHVQQTTATDGAGLDEGFSWFQYKFDFLLIISHRLVKTIRG